MNQIDPFFGPPLMFLFVTLSSILLMGSLTGMLSNSFSRVMSHAREEYLYVYSVYVLEASTSNRLTHFYPPFNLLALVIFRPLRLLLPSDNKFRAARILLLKVTHLPIVGAIMLYELVKGKVSNDEFNGFKGPQGGLGSGGSAAQRLVSRAKVRPASSSSAYAHHPQQRRPPQGELPRPVSAPAVGVPAPDPDIANDDMGAPTDTDVKIAELSSKIDRLTEIILAMQREKRMDASQHTEPAA
jgi:hypothetical protein